MPNAMAPLHCKYSQQAHRGDEGGFDAQARALTTRRAASESSRRAIPLNSMLIPTSKPTAQAVLDGQALQIMTPRMIVTIPSMNNQPEPGKGRRRNAKMNSNIPSAKR